MFDLITKSLAKIFGTKSDRDIKNIMPYVDMIQEEYQKLSSVSDQALREASASLMNIIEERKMPIINHIAELKSKGSSDESTDLIEKDKIFSQIDRLLKEQNSVIEEVLLEILPKAFAIVRETARRWKENGKLTVELTDWDTKISQKLKSIEIVGRKAVWYNKWTAAGSDVTWEMVHYDVQLIGGVALHQGKISEMATGEGKTLAATLPVFLNALAKEGVHLVTVNDYLAKRDSEWMAPLFEFHQLSVDCIDKHPANSDARRKAYAADIVYGTNNEFGFDYLRDNMAREVEELVQRKHHFAIVDEVDSVLIDDARTPLIISGPISKTEEQQFYALKPRVQKLVDEQKRICADYLNEAKKKLTQNPKDKEAALSLFRAFRGLPKSKPLIKFLSETGIKKILQETENFYLADNQKEMPNADKPLFFVIDEKHNNVELTNKGLDLITSSGEDNNFFILPDIATEMASIESNKLISSERRTEQTELLIKEYSDKSERIHTIQQLLKAYTLFEKEVEYIIVDGKVKIVDEQSGRVLDGRRYSDGLHQAIEAKENVKVEDATQTYATITLQNYFRMYHKLAGMTGTAETEAAEFWQIYKLEVVVIPTNKTCVRKDSEDKVFKSTREKFNAVADEINQLTSIGRPVLVGTTSVEISELLSRMLKMRNIKHQVLNAKYHQKEAEIVAEAGKPGTVTIATNMAGRGTDIKLTSESKAAGGLAIIGTERHESRRVDRQLRGRSGRQGDPGSSQFFVSLEDNLMRLFGSDKMAVWMDRLGLKEGEVIEHSMITKSIERAQKKVEENNFGMRKRLLEYDDVMNSQREVVYDKRRNALFGDKLKMDVLNMFYQISEDIAEQAIISKSYESFVFQVVQNTGKHPVLNEEQFSKLSKNDLTEHLYGFILDFYKTKSKHIAEKAFPIIREVFMAQGAFIQNIVVTVTDDKIDIPVVSNLKNAFNNQCFEIVKNIEKSSVLSIIDDTWKEHLREMDELKQSVQNAVYEQKDPLLVYKMEAFNLFKALVSKINEDTVGFLMKVKLPEERASDFKEAKAAPKLNKPKLIENKDSIDSVFQGPTNSQEPVKEKLMPLKSQRVAGRNDKVSVQYMDGTLKKDVKYKSVEEDVLSNKCYLID